MSNTYQWSIKKMTAHTTLNDLNNVIYSVIWSCSATTDNFSVETSGEQKIDFVEGNNFVPASNLTEETVIGWVKDAMGDQTQATITSQLDAQLQDIQAPKMKEIDLPWVILDNATV